MFVCCCSGLASADWRGRGGVEDEGAAAAWDGMGGFESLRTVERYCEFEAGDQGGISRELQRNGMLGACRVQCGADLLGAGA